MIHATLISRPTGRSRPRRGLVLGAVAAATLACAAPAVATPITGSVSARDGKPPIGAPGTPARAITRVVSSFDSANGRWWTSISINLTTRTISRSHWRSRAVTLHVLPSKRRHLHHAYRTARLAVRATIPNGSHRTATRTVRVRQR